MHPSVPGYLDELRRLAEHLFRVVQLEFTVGPAIIVQFGRVDDLARTDIETDHLVATALLCAQLLHRVTADPQNVRPRHVNTLTDVLEQVVPHLATLCPENSAAANALRGVGARLVDVTFNLMMLADPGGPDYAAE